MFYLDGPFNKIYFEVNKVTFHATLYFVGERVFRIGSFRYKMDSTKRTLLRISGGLLFHFLVLNNVVFSYLSSLLVCLFFSLFVIMMYNFQVISFIASCHVLVATLP